MGKDRYRNPEGRLKGFRLHPLRWRFGYQDHGDWISLWESSYHIGPIEILVHRNQFITSRPNWRRWTLWPRLGPTKP